MAFPSTQRRGRLKAPPRHPALIFTGCTLDRTQRLPYEVRMNHYGSGLCTILYYTGVNGRSPEIVVTPSRPDDKDMHQVFGLKRSFKAADRILWQPEGIGACLYRTIRDDLHDISSRYFTPECKAMIAAGPQPVKSLLDSLVPYEETVTNFCDTLLALFERVCLAGMVEVDEIESDFARVQKLLAYASRGGTQNEREMSITRLEVIIKRLYAKAVAQ